MNEFRIERGNATPEEIAIAVAVLTSAATGAAIEVSTKPRSRWAAPARLHRPSSHPIGAGAWALSQRMR